MRTGYVMVGLLCGTGLLLAPSCKQKKKPKTDQNAPAPAPPAASPTKSAPPPVDPWSPLEVHASKDLPFKMHVRRHRNGLTVVAVPMNTPGVIGYGTLVRVGARNEIEPGHTGFAHFFEHMMFRGTKKYPPDAYKAVLQSIGADDNAYTNKDRTFYYIVGRADALGKIVEIESDRFQHLSYQKPAFQTEARAVLGEYRKSTSRPWYKVWELLHATAFTKHTYAHITIGKEADIQAMPSRYDYSLQFFRRYYRPDNCTLIVAGDVTMAKLAPLVERYYGKWQGKSFRPKVTPEPAQTDARTAHVPWKMNTVPRGVVAYRAPAFLAAGNDSAALVVLAELAFGKASPLYRELVLEKQLLQSISVEAEGSRDPHLFSVWMELKKKAHWEAARQAVRRTLDALAAGNVDAQRVADVRSHLKYALLMGLNTPGKVLFQLARTLSPRGRPGDLVTMVEQLGAVQAADVARVAKRYLTAKRSTAITLWKDELAKGAAKRKAAPKKAMGGGR